MLRASFSKFYFRGVKEDSFTKENTATSALKKVYESNIGGWDEELAQ